VRACPGGPVYLATLSGQLWCAPPGSSSLSEVDSSIRPWLADTRRSAATSSTPTTPTLTCGSSPVSCRASRAPGQAGPPPHMQAPPARESQNRYQERNKAEGCGRSCGAAASKPPLKQKPPMQAARALPWLHGRLAARTQRRKQGPLCVHACNTAAAAAATYSSVVSKPMSCSSAAACSTRTLKP
jgi:hypothetical protein